MTSKEFKLIVSCCIMNGHILTSYFYSSPGFLDKLIILRNLQQTLQNELNRPIRNTENINGFAKDIKKICKRNLIDVEFTKDKSRIKYSISGKDITDLIYHDTSTILK